MLKQTCLCQSMTQKTAAALLSVVQSTLPDPLHRSIQRRRAGHRVRGLKNMGVVEISIRKGHKYATLAYDLLAATKPKLHDGF